MPRSTTLGERIGIARRRNGLTQSAVARYAGVTPQTISLLERGGHRTIQSDSVRKIARVLRVSTDWLMGMDLPEEEVIDRRCHGRDAQLVSLVIPTV